MASWRSRKVPDSGRLWLAGVFGLVLSVSRSLSLSPHFGLLFFSLSFLPNVPFIHLRREFSHTLSSSACLPQSAKPPRRITQNNLQDIPRFPLGPPSRAHLPVTTADGGQEPALPGALPSPEDTTGTLGGSAGCSPRSAAPARDQGHPSSFRRRKSELLSSNSCIILHSMHVPRFVAIRLPSALNSNVQSFPDMWKHFRKLASCL